MTCLGDTRPARSWADQQRKIIAAEAEGLLTGGGEGDAAKAAKDYIAERSSGLARIEAKKQTGAWQTWGQDFFRGEPSISPLRGALSVWGLTPDDIGVASFHGTSTLLNDRNESEVVNTQMNHLGRTKGNKLFVVCQKYLTGHPKGPAAAWMLNGMLQVCP
jgi:fatty acid synthase subunit alpha